jgi:hypothetical protein
LVLHLFGCPKTHKPHDPPQFFPDSVVLLLRNDDSGVVTFLARPKLVQGAVVTGIECEHRPSGT